MAFQNPISFLRFPPSKATERGRRRAGARDFVGQQGRVGAPRRWKTDMFLVSETSQFYGDAGGDFSPESCGLIWVTNSNSIIFLWYLPNKKHELYVASVDFPKKNTKSSHQDQRKKNLVKYLARKEW